MKKVLLIFAVVYLGIVGAYPLILRYGPHFVEGLEPQPLPDNYYASMALGFPVVALIVFTVWYLNRPFADKRFAATPPGVLAPDGSPTTTAGGSEVAVRFTPPDVDLMTAAVATDEIPFGNHLSAMLVHMSIEGTLVIHKQPRKIIQGPNPPASEIERKIWSLAEPPGAGWDARQTNLSMKLMSDALAEEFHRIWDGGTIREKVSLWPRRLVLLALAAVLGTAAAALLFAFMPRKGSVPAESYGVLPQLIAALIAMAVVLVIGLGISLQLEQRWRRTARGTAIKEQVDGFKLYLTTAEAEQHRFEESQDVYRRFIPWAALFFVANQWTRAITFRFPYELFGLEADILPIQWQEAGELPRPAEETAHRKSRGPGKT